MTSTPRPSLRFLIIQDPRENRRKCTLTPLESREGIEFIRLPRLPSGGACPDTLIDVSRGILLQLGAPVLSAGDRGLVEDAPIILIDASWARAPKVLARIAFPAEARIERRSIPAWITTAYPRISKLHEDPPGGLASVEALHAAAVLLGEPFHDLLGAYRWRDRFLAQNRALEEP